MECLLAGESIRQDSHLNRDRSGNDSPIRSDLNVEDVNILVVLVILVLLNPAEANQADRRMLDVFPVEEFNNLGTNASPRSAALREDHEPWNK